MRWEELTGDRFAVIVVLGGLILVASTVAAVNTAGR